MTKQEVAELLMLITAFDQRREMGQPEVEAWHAVLHNVPFQEAKRAVVAHYANNTSCVMPADVRRVALAERREAVRRELVAEGRESHDVAVLEEVRRRSGGRVLRAVE